MFSVVVYQARDFSASHAQPARRLGGHKKLGGDTDRAADPNWPKGYSRPCDITPSIQTGGSWPGGIAAQELTGHQLSSGEQLHCASLVLYIPIILLLSF